MAYRADSDLAFLSNLTSSDLNDLVYCLIYDKDGSKRLTEELSTNENYVRHYPYHARYWKDIAAEIQCFGANTFAIIARGGKGVLYKEVLCDVCSKMNVNFNKKSSAEIIEDNFLSKVLSDSIEKMSPEERKKLCSEYNINWQQVANLSPQAMASLFQTIFQAGGFKSYQLTLIVVNAMWRSIFGKGLTFAANATLTRTAAILTGPIGWVLTGIWAAIDLAGPAFRVTIPAVAQVALLRKKYLNPSPPNISPQNQIMIEQNKPEWTEEE